MRPVTFSRSAIRFALRRVFIPLGLASVLFATSCQCAPTDRTRVHHACHGARKAPLQKGRAAARQLVQQHDRRFSVTGSSTPLDDAAFASAPFAALNTIADRATSLYKNLQHHGFSFTFRGDLEGFQNFRGGIETGAVGSSTVDANMTVDTEKLFGLHGGSFDIELHDHAGSNPSTALTGDAQLFDRFNFRPYFEIYSLWYQQKLLNARLRLLAGKVDANTEFAVVSNGLIFLNSSAQVEPTNFLFPTMPAPMPGVNVFYTFKHTGTGSGATPAPTAGGTGLYAGFGLYDSNSSVAFLNFYGHPQSVQPESGGVYMIGEGGLTWGAFPRPNYDGNFRAGFWDHTGMFRQFSGREQYGVHGLYLIFDQMLWKPSNSSGDTRGLRSFVEYGQTDRAVASIYRHYGGGISWTGLLPGRRNDALGFDAQDALFSPAEGLPYGYELELETFYKAQLADYVALQPDLQYIRHPGGNHPSAVVGTLRLEIRF